MQELQQLGIANDLKLIFLISAASFIIGLIFTIKLPNPKQEKEVEPGTTKKVISKNKFLFLSLLLRHIGASAVWVFLPIMIVEEWEGFVSHFNCVCCNTQ